jgi:hypothetical protein
MMQPMFRLKFETEVSTYDARMTRDQALEWVADRGLRGLVDKVGIVTELADFSDEQLAKALSNVALDLLTELGKTDKGFNLRHEPDDEPRSWVSLRPGAVVGVDVRFVEDFEDDNTPDSESELPITVESHWVH